MTIDLSPKALRYIDKLLGRELAALRSDLLIEYNEDVISDKSNDMGFVAALRKHLANTAGDAVTTEEER